jgi:hypothetical protein
MNKFLCILLLNSFFVSIGSAQIQEQNGWVRFHIPQKSKGQSVQLYDWKNESQVKKIGSPQLKAYIIQTDKGYRIRFVPFTGRELLNDGQVRMDDRHRGSDSIINQIDNEKAYGFLAEKEGVGYFEFNYSGLDVGFLTLPFKLQWTNKPNIINSPNMLIDYNAGLYLGWRVGKVKYLNGVYRRYFITPALYSGIGRARFNVTALDEVNRMSFSYGLGVLLGVHKLNVGFILGIDSATGADAQKWDFHNGGFGALAVGVKF